MSFVIGCSVLVDRSPGAASVHLIFALLDCFEARFAATQCRIGGHGQGIPVDVAIGEAIGVAEHRAAPDFSEEIS